MNNLPTQCPICGSEVAVTRIHCRECDTTIEGRFNTGYFSQLNHEQLEFIEVFIRCEGKFTRMEDELNLSYPTIRNRLYEIIRALGYEPGTPDEAIGLTDEERKSILENLDRGLITADKAMLLLKEKGG
jgi:hypothetical protein